MKKVEETFNVIIDGTPFVIVSNSYKKKFTGTMSGIRNIIASKETIDNYLQKQFFDEPNIIFTNDLKQEKWNISVKNIKGSYVVLVDDKEILFVNRDYTGKKFNNIDNIKNIIGPKEIVDKYFPDKSLNKFYVDDFLIKNNGRKIELV